MFLQSGDGVQVEVLWVIWIAELPSSDARDNLESVLELLSVEVVVEVSEAEAVSIDINQLSSSDSLLKVGENLNDGWIVFPALIWLKEIFLLSNSESSLGELAWLIKGSIVSSEELWISEVEGWGSDQIFVVAVWSWINLREFVNVLLSFFVGGLEEIIRGSACWVGWEAWVDWVAIAVAAALNPDDSWLRGGASNSFLEK